MCICNPPPDRTVKFRTVSFLIRALALFLFTSPLSAGVEGTGFAAWQATHFSTEELLDPGVSGPLATPANDAVANLVKYALGAAPEEAVSPVVSIVGGGQPVSFVYLRDPHVQEAELVLEVSSGLDTWTPVAPTHGNLAVDKAAGGMEAITLIPASASTRMFVRLTASAKEAPRMPLGTNFWNFAWGNGRSDYFRDGVDWNTVENPWRQEFLDDLAIYSVIRFMDQVPTNSSTVRTWDERVARTANHYSTSGGAVAYEWQIDLCNRTGTDIWITVPHLTIEDYENDPTDNYWTALAQLLKEKLDANLKIYLEYSNETWSGGASFRQGDYLGERGVAMGFDSDGYTSKFYFHVYAAMRLHKVFLDAFEGEHDRIRNVVSGQANSHWGTQQVVLALRNETWSNGTDTRLNPWDLVPDYYAIANYTDTGNGASTTIRTDWTNQLVSNEARYIQHRDTIAPTRMQLISYEGGQHYTTNAHTFSTNPESYAMYLEWLNLVSKYFHLTMHYTHTGRWSNGGAWGAKSSTDQDLADAHRYRALVNWTNGSSD